VSNKDVFVEVRGHPKLSTFSLSNKTVVTFDPDPHQF
jgi:hypothetical protein